MRPGELHGAIGNIQLKKINRFINIRRKNLLLFNKLIGNNKKVIIPKTDYFHQVLLFQ